MVYLCPNGALNQKNFVKTLHQFPKLLILVLKAMTKDQGTDDVRDDVVDDEVWS